MGGGGAAGALASPTFGPEGRRPSNFGLSTSFIFVLFVFARELGSLPKNSWAKSGEFLVLGRGYLGPGETFSP